MLFCRVGGKSWGKFSEKDRIESALFGQVFVVRIRTWMHITRPLHVKQKSKER